MIRYDRSQILSTLLVMFCLGTPSISKVYAEELAAEIPADAQKDSLPADAPGPAVAPVPGPVAVPVVVIVPAPALKSAPAVALKSVRVAAPRPVAAPAPEARYEPTPPPQARRQTKKEKEATRHDRAVLSVGAGGVAGIDSASPSGYAKPVVLVDGTVYGTIFGKYGLTRMQVGAGPSGGKVPYINASLSSTGGWELIGRKGITKLSKLHIGVEGNVWANLNTRLGGELVGEGYRSDLLEQQGKLNSLVDQGNELAKVAGVGDELLTQVNQEITTQTNLIGQGKTDALNEARKWGAEIDEQGNTAHAIHYAQGAVGLSAGFQTMICETGEALALARGGVSAGTLGSRKNIREGKLPNPAPLAGVALYVDCGDFNGALEATHIMADHDNLTMVDVNFSYLPIKDSSLAVGARISAVRETGNNKLLPGDGALTSLSAVATVGIAK
jgi:hypothetical protein